MDAENGKPASLPQVQVVQMAGTEKGVEMKKRKPSLKLLGSDCVDVDCTFPIVWRGRCGDKIDKPDTIYIQAFSDYLDVFGYVGGEALLAITSLSEMVDSVISGGVTKNGKITGRLDIKNAKELAQAIRMCANKLEDACAK
jgi:hypothetical protein